MDMLHGMYIPDIVIRSHEIIELASHRPMSMLVQRAVRARKKLGRALVFNDPTNSELSYELSPVSTRKVCIGGGRARAAVRAVSV